jgi:hypothetical protein
MSRKKKPKPDDPEQSARFIDAAEKLDCGAKQTAQ